MMIHCNQHMNGTDFWDDMHNQRYKALRHRTFDNFRSQRCIHDSSVNIRLSKKMVHGIHQWDKGALYWNENNNDKSEKLGCDTAYSDIKFLQMWTAATDECSAFAVALYPTSNILDFQLTCASSEIPSGDGCTAEHVPQTIRAECCLSFGK